VLSIVPNLCLLFSMCCAYAEVIYVCLIPSLLTTPFRMITLWSASCHKSTRACRQTVKTVASATV